ncbi:serine hydrolase domain-containing protein [Actinoallomurus sp. NPDC050550]|uniref:serine hydrolase domain-containing protein n=1 Tax=Actinoallomurus sp. NPDC050550 TaxID=3154937 RepID=UPI003410578A
MSDQARRLPDRPNLRYLKQEAKRRLAAGEFATLHEAQLAIAREHGLPSWTALKEFIVAARDRDRHAFRQVGWVISRFRGAGAPDWTPPAEAELQEHFGDSYLRLVPPRTMVGTLSRVAERLGADLVVTRETALQLRAQVADLRIEAMVEADPPHRIAGLRMYPVGERVTDPRVATPTTRTSGAVPPAAVEVAEGSFAELGLVGLALAGASRVPGQERPVTWTLACGWADLERAEMLRPDHRFPAYGITKLITSTVVLRLVADGRVRLDDPADAQLRTIRLADEAVTVRELLSHTGGVDGPEEMFADEVPDAVSLLGPVVPCSGTRGGFAPGNGGYAVLGQLIADVTGLPYPEAATRTVLEPLGMSRSWFPASRPDVEVITGHRLSEDGSMRPEPTRLCTVPAAGGLWTTAADLVRFGHGWSSLLPDELVREALRPHAVPHEAGARMGLGWLLNQSKDVAGHPGSGPGAAASLIIRPDLGQVGVTLTNRLVPIESVNGRLVRPIA